MNQTLRIPRRTAQEPAAPSRLPQILALALVPLTALDTAVLHTHQFSVALAAVLLLVTTVQFGTGRLRFAAPHAWTAIITASVLLAYVVPEVRFDPTGQPRQALTWLLLGLLVLTVTVASPPDAGVLVKVILATGTGTAIVAQAQGSLQSGRLQGIQLNPNYLAVYLAASIVISAGLALSRRNPLWLVPGRSARPPCSRPSHGRGSWP